MRFTSNPLFNFFFNDDILLLLVLILSLLLAYLLLPRKHIAMRKLLAFSHPPFFYLLLGALGAGSLLNLGGAIYLGYEAPRDIMQDIVSARQFLQGRTMYPAEMNTMIRQELEREPVEESIGKYLPALHQAVVTQYHITITDNWVQAHPPIMTIFVSGFLLFFGVHGTYLAIAFLSLGCLFCALILLQRGLATPLSPSRLVLLGLFALGWYPVLSVMRNSQSGIILGFLMIAGWYALKTRRPVLAGFSIGLATALKLYPGLLGIYLLIRHRRAFASWVGSVIFFFLAGLELAGWQSYVDYFRITRYVTSLYGKNFENLSLLGPLTRISGGFESTFPIAKILFLLIGLGSVGALAWIMWRGNEPGAPDGVGEGNRIDLEYSLFISLLPLLSPISWNHYLPVLALPILVLAKQLITPQAHTGHLLAFLSLLLLISLPADTLRLLFHNLAGTHLLLFRCYILLTSLTTLAMAAISLWLLALYNNTRLAAYATVPVRASRK